jgi:hypothetical protein
MTWFKVDDSFYDHPKVFDAPDCAVALWTRAGTWSARNLTDGFVPTGMPARLCDDPDRAVRELLNRGLWSRSKGGYLFHDWREYQPTREEAIASAQKMSSGGSLGNHRRWHVGKGKVDPSCRYCQDKRDRGTDRPPDRVPDTPPESPPNPPGPSRPGPLGGGGSNATNGRAHASQEPPSRCPEHIDDPDPPACRRCADARRAHEAWERDRPQGRVELQREVPRCHTHPGQPANTCGLCRSERIGAQ